MASKNMCEKVPVMAKDTRLYVGGLFCEVTDADLIGRFEKFGDVSSVHIVRRTDDKGKPERTFAYVNLTATDQNLKKCMAVYNKSKWKGHDMQIQVAKESFLARLAKEREATKMNAKEPSVMQTSEIPEPSHGRQWTVQGAAPGTAVEGERNWVVGKYGRILPVVYIRRKDKKKVMKVNPSKYSHNLKKVKEEHTMDTPISQLTWNIQVQGTEESRKKRQGDFSDFMKGRWKRSAATLQTKNKKMKMDLRLKSEEHLSNSGDSDPNISSKSIVQSVEGKGDTGDFGGRWDNQTIQDVSKTSAVGNSQGRVDESENESKSSKEFSNTTTIDVGHADDDDGDFEVVSLEQHDQRMTGVLDGNMLLGFKTLLVHKKQGEGKAEDSDGSVDTDELITATKHHLVQHMSVEKTLESGTASDTAETSVSSRQKLQGTAQVVGKNSSSNQDGTDDLSESEASDDAEMIAAARVKLQTIMSSPRTIKNGGKQAEKGLKVPVTTEPEKSTTEVSTSTDVQESISMDGATDHMVTEQLLEKTGSRKDSSHGMEMTCPSNLGQEQGESNTSHNSTQQESNIDDDNSYEDTQNLPIETTGKGGHCQKIDITGKPFESFKSNDNWEDADDSNSQELTDTSDTIPSLPEDNKNTSFANAVFEASDDDGGSDGGDNIDDDDEEDDDGDNIDDEEKKDDDGDNIDDDDDEDVDDDGDNIDDDEEEEDVDDDGDNIDDDEEEEDVDDDGDNIDDDEEEEDVDDDGDNIDDVEEEEDVDDDGDNIDDEEEEEDVGDNIDEDEEDVDDEDVDGDDDDDEEEEEKEEEEKEDVDGGDDNVDSDDHVVDGVDADEEDDNDDDCNDELEDDESPDSDSTGESLSELHSFEENESGNESSSEDSSDPEVGRYKEVKMTTNKSPDGTFPTKTQKVLEESASNVTVSGPIMSSTSMVDIRKGPVDQQKLQSSAVGEGRTLANEQRLQSLRQRQLQAQSKQDLIRKALSPMASSTAGKHTVFDSEEEDSENGIEVREETWSSTHQPAKTGKKTPQIGLFESDSEEDSVSGSEDSDDQRFQIKPQFEGKTGEKLLELQAQIGQDDRFRMDHRFLEEDSDGDEDDMTKTPTCTDGTGVAEELEAEKQKALEILRSVVGTKAAMATEKGKNIDKLKFKDPSAVRYDPTREDHKQFEIPENESQKDVEESGAGTSKEPKITPPEEAVPNTTKDRYFQVASDLKEAFSSTGGQTFSFFGPSTAETIEDMEADGASESTQTAPRKLPWQPKVFQYDSSDDDDDDEITQEDLEKIPEKVEEPKRRNAFFFTDDDSRLKEGMMQFYRRDKLEDIREAWEEVRPELLEESKKRHKNAVRQRKKNQKNRPRHKYK